MKKISLFLAFLCTIIVFASCSEDFKVGAPYKESMIVYGLLDKGDTAHYIKITRGFFDAKNNNLLAAKNIDSLYYDSLTVTISEITNNTVVNVYPLQKVNLIAEGIAKDSGIFINQPSFAYKFKANLNSNFEYKLTITNPKTDKIVTCQTNILESNANVFIIDAPQENGELEFGNTAQTTDFNFTPPPNSAIVEMYLRFRYYEVTKTGMDSVGILKFADLPIFTRKEVPNAISPITYTFEHKNFLGLVAGGIGYAPLNVRRYVDTPDVIFYIGGKELKKYIDVTNAQGGITADQIQPIYTNMQGGSAYGILSSRVKREVKNLNFRQNTIDSLILSLDATNLRIVGISPL
jgi:hypothetical protein